MCGQDVLAHPLDSLAVGLAREVEQFGLKAIFGHCFGLAGLGFGCQVAGSP